jgi:hypothetical protein
VRTAFFPIAGAVTLSSLSPCVPPRLHPQSPPPWPWIWPPAPSPARPSASLLPLAVVAVPGLPVCPTCCTPPPPRAAPSPAFLRATTHRRHLAAQTYRASFIAIVKTICQDQRRPLPGWTRLAAHPFIAFAGSVAVAAFPAGSTLLRPSRPDPSSLWTDCVFPAGSVVAVAFSTRSVVPLLFCRGRGHHDLRRPVRCCWPPWWGSLTSGQSKKQEGRPASALLLCLPADVDARTSTPPKDQASAACLPTATTSTSATSASRGYRLLGAHTDLYSSHNIRTIMMLRLRGISTRRLLPSASTPVSSCVVPPL